MRPEQKAEFVKKLQAAGERVAFVGDGINDSPALTQADLGIAVSRASDVAREAADIILLKSEIEAVPEALGLARATLRTIKQNLFWAFFYNALGVPLAGVMGFTSPIFVARRRWGVSGPGRDRQRPRCGCCGGGAADKKMRANPRGKQSSAARLLDKNGVEKYSQKHEALIYSPPWRVFGCFIH